MSTRTKDEITADMAALQAQLDSLEKGEAPGDELASGLEALNAFHKSALSLDEDPDEIEVQAAGDETAAAIDEPSIEIETDPEVDDAINAFPVLKSYFGQLARTEAKIDALRAEMRASMRGEGVMAKAVSLLLTSSRDLVTQVTELGAQGTGRRAQVQPFAKTAMAGRPEQGGAEEDPEAKLRGRVLAVKAEGLFAKGRLTNNEVAAIETFTNAGRSLLDIRTVHPALANRIADGLAAE